MATHTASGNIEIRKLTDGTKSGDNRVHPSELLYPG